MSTGTAAWTGQPSAHCSAWDSRACPQRIALDKLGPDLWQDKPSQEAVKIPLLQHFFSPLLAGYGWHEGAVTQLEFWG